MEEHRLNRPRIVILYSGGLDSLLMYRFAKIWRPDHEVIPMFIDHGQESLEQEMKGLPPETKIKKMDWLGEDVKPVAKPSMPLAGPIYIPGRNMIFAAMAASYYLPEEIWLGVLKDENNERATDKNNTFRYAASSLFEYVLSPFGVQPKVVFPFSDNGWTKFDAIRSALALNIVTREELKATVSCWHHDGKPCGKCLQCVKRALIFRNFDIEEEYSGLSPFDAGNGYACSLMNGYLTTPNPDFEERMMQDLIHAFAMQEKFTGTFK